MQILSSLSTWTYVNETPVEEIWIEPEFLIPALPSESSSSSSDRTVRHGLLMALPGSVEDDVEDNINFNDWSNCQDETRLRTPTEPTFSLLPNGRRKKSFLLEWRTWCLGKALTAELRMQWIVKQHPSVMDFLNCRWSWRRSRRTEWNV